jgi:hypothetical protein
VTYKIQVRNNSGTAVYLNRRNDNYITAIQHYCHGDSRMKHEAIYKTLSKMWSLFDDDVAYDKMKTLLNTMKQQFKPT